jgi:hypothetical protein
MSNRRNHYRTARRNHLWGVGIGMAATAAAMIGMGTAHADTPDDVIDQAITDLNQGAALVDAAPTAGVSAQDAGLLSEQASIGSQEDQVITDIGTSQEGLSAADQTFLANADEQLVTAAQSVLSADQAIVAADKAGDLSSSFTSVDLTALVADTGLLSADFNSLGDTFLVLVDPDIASLLP